MTNTGQNEEQPFIIGQDDLILVTGAAGFIGSKVVEKLLDRGFRNILCFARPSGNMARIEALRGQHGDARLEVFTGNLLSREDSSAATRDAKVVFHLAASRGEKSIPAAFLNSVVTTRNLLDACVGHQRLQRFVNISSFAVYAIGRNPRRGLLDETCPMESQAHLRCDAYTFAKIKQDEIVSEYGKKFGLPFVIVRPGYAYGPGRLLITSRVGIDTFGFFLHLGGSNKIPFTYVDNCADAIALAGLTKGVDGEIFNVVDDDLPSSRRFLRQYKRNVKRFRSLYLPHFGSYLFCYFWERYSAWSQGQLEPVFNRSLWRNHWKKTRYSNQKLKTRLGWLPTVSTQDALNRYFQACRDGGTPA